MRAILSRKGMSVWKLGKCADRIEDFWDPPLRSLW